MNCKICESGVDELFRARVLNKYEVKYFKCQTCGFIQTETPFWMEEAYGEAINTSDVGLVSRNLNLSAFAENLIIKQFNPGGKFIDYGGGYGLFVRLMRDKGLDFFLYEPRCENIFARYFTSADASLEGKYELLTSFEVFEHIEDPKNEIKKMFELSDSILFSTQLQDRFAYKSADEWWYFAPETGQHIAFYTAASLEYLANYFGCNLFSDNVGMHLFTKKKLTSDPFEDLKAHPGIMTRLFSKLLKGTTEKKLPSLLEKDFQFLKSKK